jgi:hypothetical protein
MELSYFKYEGGIPDEKEIPKIFIFWYWVFYCCFFLELMMDRIGLSKIKRNQKTVEIYNLAIVMYPSI